MKKAFTAIGNKHFSSTVQTVWSIRTPERFSKKNINASKLSEHPPTFFIDVCMLYSHQILLVWCKGKDHPGKVANPARGQLNRENEYFRVPARARVFKEKSEHT